MRRCTLFSRERRKGTGEKPSPSRIRTCSRSGKLRSWFRTHLSAQLFSVPFLFCKSSNILSTSYLLTWRATAHQSNCALYPECTSLLALCLLSMNVINNKLFYFSPRLPRVSPQRFGAKREAFCSAFLWVPFEASPRSVLLIIEPISRRSRSRRPSRSVEKRDWSRQ